MRRRAAIWALLASLYLVSAPSTLAQTTADAHAALGRCIAIVQGLSLISADRTVRPQLSPEGTVRLLSVARFRRVLSRHFGPVGRAPTWAALDPQLHRLPRGADEQRARYLQRQVLPPILALLEIPELTERRAQLNTVARAMLQVYCLCGAAWQQDPSLMSLGRLDPTDTAQALQQAQAGCGHWGFLTR